MDTEFLGLSLVFILIGAAGIVLFYGPMNSTGDSCYCLIPSPEPGAAQGTSSIILALGLLFFPMGLMKGGLPSLRRGPALQKQAVQQGAVAAPIPIMSGRLFGLGVVLTLLGVDAILVPGYLVVKSIPIAGAGAALAALGGALIYLGLRKPEVT